MKMNVATDEWVRVKLPHHVDRQDRLLLVKNHILPELGEMDMEKITSETIHSYLERKASDGLSVVTVRMLGGIIKSVLRVQGFRPKVILPKNREEDSKVLTHDEQLRLEVFLNKNTDINKLDVLLCLHTGMRVNELGALKWEDIGEREIFVRNGIKRIAGKGLEIYVLGGKSQRRLPIPVFLKEKLEEFRPKNQQAYFLSCEAWMVEPRYVERRLAEFGEDCEIPGLTFRVLRNTFVHRAAEFNMDSRELLRRLGCVKLNKEFTEILKETKVVASG
ncbi:hypothetical protein FACS1894202_11880 [Clostridia bacterium]|nr:hypothetical protein FACS1894202_11880 [Clostridia bacterium]